VYRSPTAPAALATEGANRARAFVCSYPKSGRTWMRFALAHYMRALYGLELDIDLRSMFRLLPNMDGFAPDCGKDASVYTLAHRPEVPLLLSSHLCFDERLFGSRPVVFILRCPYDVMVSSYLHKTRQEFSWEGPLKAFLRDPHVGVAELVRYLNSWAPRLKKPGALVLTYEQLRIDPESGFLCLAAHLGIQAEPAIARIALSQASFEKMSDVERRVGIEGYDYDWWDPEARRVRRAQIGGYRDYLDEQDCRYVITACVERLAPAARALLERRGLAPWSGPTRPPGSRESLPRPSFGLRSGATAPTEPGG
jgi:Sulfotransferase domain